MCVAVVEGVSHERYNGDPPVANILRAVQALDAEVRGRNGAKLSFSDQLAYCLLAHAISGKLATEDTATLSDMAAPLAIHAALYQAKLEHRWPCYLTPLGAMWREETRPLLAPWRVASCGTARHRPP